MRLSPTLLVAALFSLGCGDPEPAPSVECPDCATHAFAEATALKCPPPRVPLATRLGARISEICAEAAIDPQGRDVQADILLRGHWQGQYDDETMDPVDFEADLDAVDGTVRGSTTEPDTFGYGYGTLEANLYGDIYASHQVVLLKTYFGATDHSVLYIGILDRRGKRIDGHWRVGDSRGTFWMTRSD